MPGRRRRAPQRAGRAPERKRREPQQQGRVPRRTGKAPPRTERAPPRTGRASPRTGRASLQLSGPRPGMGALRPGRIPPTRVATAEQGNARSSAADAEPLGGLANPAEPAARPTRPQTPRWCSPGGEGHPEPAGVRVAVQRPSAPVPPPRRLATHRDQAGRWALFHRGRGGAGRGAVAERGAGRGGRPCAEGEEAGDASRSLDPALGGGGRGLQEIQTLRQEIGILTKHSRPAAAPRRGLPPRLTLGPPAHCKSPE